MIPLPDQNQRRLYALPWVALAIMLVYLLVLLTYQGQEEQQRRALFDWYQDTGLFSMEWDNYLSWLRINGRGDKAAALAEQREAGHDIEPFLDMAFNPRFEAENRERGSDYWSAEAFRHWKEQREEFRQRANELPRYFAGLIPTDPRPGRFLTWHFLHDGLIHWALCLLVLAPFAWPLEARLGKARSLVLWLLGGVAAGLGPVWLFAGHYQPVIGSSAVVSAWIGAFASLFARRRLPFGYIHPRTRQTATVELPALILLPLWGLLPLYAFMRTDDGGVLLSAQLFGLAGGALLAQLIQDTGMQQRETDDADDEENRARARALTEGWDALARFEFSDAEKHFLQAREHQSDNFDALTGLFLVRKVQPEAETFQATLRELLQRRPADPDEGRQREQLLHQLVREERLPALPEELQLDIAWLLARAGDPQQAEPIVADALERKSKDPNLTRALHALAEAWEKKGDSARAEGFRHKAAGND